ncbi:MAG: response regulator transcription factor [Burkholderiaceae bacterium]
MRILLADDHALIRAGFKRLFGQTADIQVVGEAADGAQVLERLRGGDVDLLLLDLDMPGLSGADLIRRVRAHHPRVAVLVLSLHDEVEMARCTLAAGARGYLTKDQEPAALLAGLRKVAAGGRALNPALAERLALRTVMPAPAHRRLSTRELQILGLLSRGLGVCDIASRLLISHKTVSTHKARLMEKMEFDNTAELILYGLSRGFDEQRALVARPSFHMAD